MRASVLVVGAFALLADASPPYSNKECFKALHSYPSAKAACSSYLKTTVTPCPKKSVVTKTSTKVVTTTVTTTILTVTQPAVLSTPTPTTDPNAIANADPNADPNADANGDDGGDGDDDSFDNKRRAVAKCPSSSKPTKIPAALSQRCNSKLFSSVCAAIGVKPSTTTLRALTSVSTTTATVVSRTTTIVKVTATVTATPESCFYLYTDVIPNAWLSVGLSSGGFRYSISDSQTQFSLSDTGNLLTTDPDIPSAMGYTRLDANMSPYPDLEYLGFTSDVSLQTLICRIEGDQLLCDSNADGDQINSDLLHCVWDLGNSKTKVFAYHTGDIPAECTAASWKVVLCSSDPDSA